MENEAILVVRRRALEDAAKIADAMAQQNRDHAIKLHKRSARLIELYGQDAEVAEQNKISAQVLDACAEEARVIALRIRMSKPAMPGQPDAKDGEAGI